MDQITICVYNDGSRGKKVARRNGRRINLRDAYKLVESKTPVKKLMHIGYTELTYEVEKPQLINTDKVK